MQIKYKKEMALSAIIFLLLLLIIIFYNYIDNTDSKQINSIKKNNYNDNHFTLEINYSKADNNTKLFEKKINNHTLDIENQNNKPIELNSQKNYYSNNKDINNLIEKKVDNIIIQYIDFEDSYQEPKVIKKTNFNKPYNIVYTTSEYDKYVLKSLEEIAESKIDINNR